MVAYNQEIMESLSDYTGNFNERVMAYLEDQGIPRSSYNEMLRNYLLAEGYEGYTLNELIRNVDGGLAQLFAAVKRYILNFNGTQYAVLSEPVVLDGDFEIEVYFSINFSANAGWSTILSGPGIRVSGGGTNDSSGVGSLRADGTSFGGTIGGENSVFDLPFRFGSDKIERLSIVRSGSNWTFNNGRSDGSIVRNAGSVELSTFFRNVSPNGADDSAIGTIFSARIWKNGDRNTGELVTNLRFDEPDTIYQRDVSKPVGAELVTNGSFDTSTGGWEELNSNVTWSSGAIRVTSATTGVAARAAAQEITGLIPGKTYFLSGELVGAGGTDSGNCSCVLNMRSLTEGSYGITSTAFPRDGLGQKLETVFTADSPVMNLWARFDNGNADETTYVEYDNLSIREWSGAILENVLPGDWEEISKKSGDDFWLGTTELRRSDEEITANTPSTYDSSIGVLHVARTSEATGGCDISEKLVTGQSYKFYAKYKDYFGPVPAIDQIGLGLYRAFSVSDLVPREFTPVTSTYLETSHIGTSASDSSLSVILSSGGMGISMKDISIKRYLEYAEGALIEPEVPVEPEEPVGSFGTDPMEVDTELTNLYVFASNSQPSVVTDMGPTSAVISTPTPGNLLSLCSVVHW